MRGICAGILLQQKLLRGQFRNMMKTRLKISKVEGHESSGVIQAREKSVIECITFLVILFQ